MDLNLHPDINLIIVDDNTENLYLLSSILEQDGLKIITTTYPKKVSQLCIDHDVSIALIDVHMPQMDGFELLDQLKANPLTEHIMVVLMTGYSVGSEYVVKGLSKGAVDYLFKPLDMYVTLAKVNSLITLVNHQREIERKNQELQNYQEELFKALEETEKSKIVKENFLANMSHEIRTPLNAIIGLTHLLKGTSLGEDQLEMIKLMEISSQSLRGIVNDILESAKMDAGKIEIVRAKTNVIDLVNDICNLTGPMALEKGLKLVCHVDEDVPPMIMVDSLRLSQILMNLVNNAIKFTPSGSVSLHLKLLEKNDENALLEFVVTDTGIGIPKSSEEKIFTRFEQIDDRTWQKFGGTGLGLSIVKRLVELKGGTLKVDSKEGAGSTFTFTNWYALADAVKDVDDAQEYFSDLPKFDNDLILLAEDNAVSQFLIVKMLKEWNIKVDVAVNGWEAFQKLKSHNYDLILMDVHMPVMNGNEATKKIRSEMIGSRKDIPILSFSASVIQREKDEAKNAGSDDFIEKPFEPITLHHKIRNMIDKRKAVSL